MAVMKKKQNKQNINEIFPVLFKRTFHYSSSYWTDRNEYNSPGGETGFDENEMKLTTYWNTSFSRICLGMKIDQQLRFIVVNKQADSLYSLIANGKYRETSLGRNTWKEMVGANASLQKNCNKEGFNVVCQATDSPIVSGYYKFNFKIGCLNINSVIKENRLGQRVDEQKYV